jgi:hypothetical protein
MLKALVIASIAIASVMLGGCAGGGVSGNSVLPTAGVHRVHPLDSVGFGPVPTHVHRVSAAGAEPVRGRRIHKLDSVGFGPVP